MGPAWIYLEQGPRGDLGNASSLWQCSCPGTSLCYPSCPPSLVSPQCIVIGLQSTGEARTREVLDENDGHLNCFVSAAE